MLSSSEIAHPHHGAWNRHGRDDFDVGKLRYQQDRDQTDADVDGAPYSDPALTSYYRQMPDIITQGHLFIAQPPLYKVNARSSERYLQGHQGARVIFDRSGARGRRG
jgi:DNA gyrase subunit B